VPSLLRTPNFRSFWIGETVSFVGDQVTLLAMPLVAILVLDADARKWPRHRRPFDARRQVEEGAG
jgi:hypothetical protein